MAGAFETLLSINKGPLGARLFTAPVLAGSPRGIEDARLYHFDDLAAAQAAGAYFKRRLGPSDHGLDFMNVGLPRAACSVFCVAYLVTRYRTLAAYVTPARHNFLTLLCLSALTRKHTEKSPLCKGARPAQRHSV
jgi:hypothetical protein